MTVRTRTCLFLLLYTLAVCLLFAGNVPLLDPDEPVYGETAKEMIATGDFLSPRIYGAYWYDKPPLFYWLEVLSFSLFGVSEWSARFPSALCAAATVLYTYLAARRPFGEKTAAFGAFILASSLEMVLLARSSVTDMALVLTLTVALFSFLRKEYIPAYIACGFALLAKGPVGYGFPALIVALWLILQKKFTFRPIMALRWYWGIPLAFLVGLPWYVYMTVHHGSAFVDTFLGYHNITRFVAPEHAGQDKWWLYVPVLLAGFFPWAGTLPGILGGLRKDWKNPAYLYLYVWAGFIFLFFSLSSTQLISYILPMYPPLALLAARYLLTLLEEGRHRLFFPICHGVLFFIMAAALLAAPLTPEPRSARWILALFLAASALFSSYAFYKGRLKSFAAAGGISLLALVTVVWTGYALPVSEAFTSKAIVAELSETKRDETLPLYIDPFYRPASAFYENLYGRALPKLDRDEVIQGPAYVLVQKKLIAKWNSPEKDKWHLLWEKDTAALYQVEP